VHFLVHDVSLFLILKVPVRTLGRNLSDGGMHLSEIHD